MLYFDKKAAGLIQCKKFTTNLSPATVSEEIIKFALHAILDEELIPDLQNFTYYFAVSKGFSGTAISLLSNFNGNIVKEEKLEEWTKSVIKKNKNLESLSFEKNQAELIKILSSLKVEKIIPADIGLWLSKNQEILEHHFEIKKVTDNKLVKQVEEKVDQIIQILKPDEEKEISAFYERYKDAAITRLDSINFPGLKKYQKGLRELEIEDLYVAPLFCLESKKENDLSVAELFSTLKAGENLVILGTPGAGKSLLVKYCMVKILKETGKELGLDDLIPFRIELREYNQERRKSGINIIKYLKKLIHQECQFEFHESVLIKIFECKKTIFFFDGLDEIFDPIEKSKVRKDIETFVATRSLMKAVITSRFIGYHQTAQSSKNFIEASIQNFNSNQVDALARKFYGSNIFGSPVSEKDLDSFRMQLFGVDDELKKEPFILSLILILAIKHLRIPDSKLKVYEACTNLLVETRDRDEKKLVYPFLINPDHKRQLFRELAYWQYHALSKQEEVSYESALAVIAGYLDDNGQFESSDQVDDAAENFIDFAEQRSIYFENNFTHKLFLEYYTASYIHTEYHCKGLYQERDEIITQYLPNPFWNVVLELLISKVDEDRRSHESLDDLITTQLNTQPELTREIYCFFLRCLRKTKNIGVNIKERVLKESILFSLENDWGNYGWGDHPNYDEDIFLEIGRVVYSEGLLSVYKNVFFQLKEEKREDKLEEKRKLYTFYLELNHVFSDEIDILQLENDEEFQAILLEYHNLFSTYHYANSCRETAKEKDFLSAMKTEIQQFGFDSIFYEPIYVFNINSGLIGSNDIYFRRCKTLDNMEEFKKWFFMLKEAVEGEEEFPDCYVHEFGFGGGNQLYRKMFKASELYFQSDNPEMDRILFSIIENHKNDCEYHRNEDGKKTIKEYIASFNKIRDKYQNHLKLNDYIEFAMLKEQRSA